MSRCYQNSCSVFALELHTTPIRLKQVHNTRSLAATDIPYIPLWDTQTSADCLALHSPDPLDSWFAYTCVRCMCPCRKLLAGSVSPGAASGYIQAYVECLNAKLPFAVCLLPVQ